MPCPSPANRYQLYEPLCKWSRHSAGGLPETVSVGAVAEQVQVEPKSHAAHMLLARSYMACSDYRMALAVLSAAPPPVGDEPDAYADTFVEARAPLRARRPPSESARARCRVRGGVARAPLR